MATYSCIPENAHMGAIPQKHAFRMWKRDAAQVCHTIREAATRSTKSNARAKKKNPKQTTNNKRGRAGIEPATSPTRTENHTSRPTARVPVKVASSEDRTRDLALTRRMLCQLSYRGEDEAKYNLA